MILIMVYQTSLVCSGIEPVEFPKKHRIGVPWFREQAIVHKTEKPVFVYLAGNAYKPSVKMLRLNPQPLGV